MGVGTQKFWAPEVFDGDYGPKADIWAMGITMFGLLEARFPFMNENEVRHKVLKMPIGLHPQCALYLQAMLEKEETRRSCADALTSHMWLKPGSAMPTSQQLPTLLGSSTPAAALETEDNKRKAGVVILERQGSWLVEKTVSGVSSDSTKAPWERCVSSSSSFSVHAEDLASI